MTISSLFIACFPLTTAFMPLKNNDNLVICSAHKSNSALHMESAVSVSAKPLRDSLGLYPENSPQRPDGLEPPESCIIENKEATNPLCLYPSQSPDVSSGVTSSSLPIAARPPLLDGTLPGDRGFDPFNFAADAAELNWQREAELKHARIAMLAAVGWPLAELFHGEIATAFGLPNMLSCGDRAPTILNDGLSHAPFPVFWIVVLAMAAAIEIRESVDGYLSIRISQGKTRFDPYNPYDKQMHFMLEAELLNGRLGMLAVTGYAVQEWILDSAVVNQVPIFFKPISFV